MLTSVIIEKSNYFVSQLRSIHSDAISSNTDGVSLDSDEKSAFFESIESNLKKLESAVFKKINFNQGDYEYSKPSAKVIAPLKSETIKSKLSFLKGEFSAFAEKLKNENYRLTDGNKNENHTFIPAEKGLFKKIISGIEQLVELY